MSLAAELPLWSVLPFVALLLTIAVLPMLAPTFWESNARKALVVLVLAAPAAVYLPLAHGEHGLSELLLKLEEFTSFIVLLASLYMITGGILVRGSLSGTPLVNTILLGIGASIASFIGTTGASILLIRPLLRANAPRQRKAHIVVFFIFIVSNCGGLLTPLGDPPLFLGFLKGIPFEWTLSLWPQWLFVNGALLLIFSFVDQFIFDREERERPGSQLEEVQEHEPLRLSGKRNFVFLLGVVLVIYASGVGLGNAGEPWVFGVREALMAALAAIAYASTSPAIRAENEFTFHPITEVGIIFAGLFVAMAPPLLLLNAHAASLGVKSPWQFFWATGLLSSFLDNAPTYLAFAAAACGLSGIGLEGRYLATLLEVGDQGAALLVAISCGAVFMGANTYIGNGPNFMVKSIAEEWGVRMPSFFGYMAWSGAILLPLFLAQTLLFY